MRGLLSYGSHVPVGRLSRSLVGGKPGSRSIAWHDENTTSMGVEAARAALRAAPRAVVGSLLFSTANPAYLDKTNAVAIHAALGLPADAAAYDLLGSVRSAVGAIRLAAEHADGPPALVVLADIRTGRSGSTDERDGGDGAAALVIGDERDGPLLAEIEAFGSASAEFLDRWRLPGELGSRVWEERFGEQAYVPLVEQAVADACKAAGITPDDLGIVVTAGLHGRAIRSAVQACGLSAAAAGDDLAAVIGNTGSAAPGLAIIDALERAEAGARIALVSVADGADVIILRAAGLASERATAVPLRAQLDRGRDVDYQTYLTWRGALEREPPRRPDPERPAAPPAARRAEWKYAFVGSRCTACGTRHLPPQRSCIHCGAVDEMVGEPIADVLGTVATFTIDHLAYSLSPPMVVAAVDFGGGGRFQCELTDVDPTQVRIGDRVEMTFRCLFTAGGVHNYFWKARPAHPRPDDAV
ncbi:MAG: OB-fold domain-containing protein [Ilumatobacteraceae bacterium]